MKNNYLKRTPYLFNDAMTIKIKYFLQSGATRSIKNKFMNTEDFYSNSNDNSNFHL